MSNRKIPETEPIALISDGLPFSKYTRNSAGLIEGVTYQFNEDGSINYRKMVNTKYIVLNKDKKQEIESKYGRNFDELQVAIQEKTIDETDIDDKYKLILLAGIKEVAKLRGYTSVDYFNNATNPEYTAAKCIIQWIGNYETNNLFVSFAALADAHIGNTKGFSQYLNAVVENRAFVRAVRNFLNIHIVGFDEIGSANPTEELSNEVTFSATDPRTVLVRKFEELKSTHQVSWATFQKYLIEQKNIDDAKNWKNVSDVPIDRAYEITGLVAKQHEKITEKKKKKIDE